MNASDKAALAVVIPVFNESACIEKAVSKWHRESQRFGKFLLIIINDGSTDDTGPILDRVKQERQGVLVIHQMNAGHGPSILKGYRIAIEKGYEWIFQVDSDDQFEPGEFWKLWGQTGNFDFILGQRKKRQDVLFRRLGSFIGRLLLLLLFGKWIADPNIGFRLLRADRLKAFIPKINPKSFAPNLQLSILAAYRDEKINYVPVECNLRETGKSILNFRRFFQVGVNCVKDLVKLRISIHNN